MLRRGLMGIGALGALLFGAALLLALVQPLLIERGARELLRIEIERRVHQRIDQLDERRLGALAREALGRLESDEAAATQQMREGVARLVDATLARMQDASCECRRRMAEWIERSAHARVDAIGKAQVQLKQVAESAYASASRRWLREFRIITGTNAVAFALIALIAAWRPRAQLHLAVPALLVLIAVGITGYGYLFAQDWLHTVLYNDYLGYSYVVWLVVVVGFLGDIVLNRGRVTTGLLNGIGGVVSAVPC